jgi:hypothetical protein
MNPDGKEKWRPSAARIGLLGCSVLTWSLPWRTSSGLAKRPRMKKPFEAGSKGLRIVRGVLS